MWYAEERLLPLSGIQHLAFCERQWALIHVEQQWAENGPTVEGRHLHERAHDPFFLDEGADCLVARSVPLVSRTLGLYGQADVVEFRRVSAEVGGVSLPGREGYWLPKPVEYKRGKPKPDERDEVQLCAQAMCLEEMLNTSIATGDLYYGEIRRRRSVCLTASLRQRVEELCLRMHALFEAGITPRAERGKRCQACSLIDVCIPALTRKPRSVRGYIVRHLADTERDAGE
ncbi:MAG: CRISPR-associated protein Cas4 [Betaproteobacteria bacterium]